MHCRSAHMWWWKMVVRCAQAASAEVELVGEMFCTSCPCTKCSHTTQLWGQTKVQTPQCSSTKITLIWLHQIYFSQCHYLQQWCQACFGRIVPFIGQMATECLVMPQTASACMLATIQGMKFYEQTAHSDSPGFFTSTLSTLILGVLQGSRAAPCIWLSIICVLLHALSTHTTGFQGTCPC